MRCSDGSLCPPVPIVDRPRRLMTKFGVLTSLLVIVSVAALIPALPPTVALNAMPTSTKPPTGIVAGSAGALVMIQLLVLLSTSPVAGIDSGCVPVLVMRMVCVGLGVVLLPALSSL